MTNLRKIMAVILAITMIMSLAVSVVATPAASYSITVNNTEQVDGSYVHDGETYYAYKIFDLSYDTSSESYSYYITKDSLFWDAIKAISNVYYSDNTSETATGTAYFKLTQINSTDQYLVEPLTGAILSGTGGDYLATDIITALSTAAEGFNTTTDPSGYGVLSNGTASIDLTSAGAGYYYVTTTVGTAVMITNTAPTGVVNDKNTEPTVEKTVYDADGDPYATGASGQWTSANNAQIGDTVYFQSVIDNLSDIEKLTLHDDLDSGLTLDTDSIKVYFIADGTTAYELNTTTQVTNGTETYYTFTYNTTPITHSNPSFECDFEVVLDNLLASTTYSAQIDEDSIIVVTYSAKVNEEAVVYSDGSNDNETYVSYGESSYSQKSKTSTYVYSLEVYKYTETSTALQGVGFKLYYYVDDAARAADEKTYIVATLDSGVYTVGDGQDPATYTTNSGEATEFFTDINGTIKIYGLDADKTYYLTETTPLSGYNKLTSDIELTITEYNETTNTSNTAGTVTYGSTANETNQSKVSVQNNKGTGLPDTGGIGTTIFYVVGGILVVGAVVLLITKKRLGNKED